MARVVVIGAGAGGLAVAARLAAKRHEVTVLERSEKVGGNFATAAHDGFTFDVGPSLFTLPAVYRDLFLKTGAPLEHEVDLRECEPGFRYGFADGSSLQLPGSSIGRTALRLGEQFGPLAEREWRSLMDHAAAVWRLSRADVLQTPLESPRQFARLARDPQAVRTIAPWRSLERLADRRLTDRRLRDVLKRYATYSGSDPGRAPGALVTIPFVETTFGLWHVAGGLGTLAGAMATRAEKAGATFVLNTTAHTIEHVDQEVRSVITIGGERFPADIVISDIDSRWLPDLLGRPSAHVRGSSYSGFAMLLGLAGRSDSPADLADMPGTGRPAALAHHNVWFPTDYAQEFRDLRNGRPVRDPAIYVCRPHDPQMAPADHESWFVLVNTPRHGSGGQRDTFDWTDRASAEEYGHYLLAVLAARGVEVRDRVRFREVQTPLDLAHRDGSRDGAIYGAVAHGRFGVGGAASNITGLKGLYVIGGTAHPGGGLPLVGMSAAFIADRIGRAR